MIVMIEEDFMEELKTAIHESLSRQMSNSHDVHFTLKMIEMNQELI